MASTHSRSFYSRSKSSAFGFAFPQDPGYAGPGLWYMLHLKSRYAITEERIYGLIDDLWLLAKRHPCPVCRKHMSSYLTKNPPIDHMYHEEPDNPGINIGMFYYVWLFHNAVNTRLGKSLVSFEVAKAMFYHDDSSEEDEDIVPCTNCGREPIVPGDSLFTSISGTPISYRSFSPPSSPRSVSPTVSQFLNITPTVVPALPPSSIYGGAVSVLPTRMRPSPRY